MLTAQRALISVWDKRGLGDLARGLQSLGIEILSTGGTFRALQEEELTVLQVTELTGVPEILDGRVKTLHPQIHGGILADRARSTHLRELDEHNITPIDLVVVNLYPFRQTASAQDKSFEEVIEMIDVGGPTMVRAAAKNYQGVVVVVDPDDYPQVLTALEEGEGTVPETLRHKLAIKAFRHTQAYDAAIAVWLEQQVDEGADLFPRHYLLDLEREFSPRYGENPHQEAAVYRTLGSPGILGGFQQLQGKQLSWNNLLDASESRSLAEGFEQPVAVLTKHGNPCGVGIGENPAQAFERGLACDPDSAFGSIVALNRVVDRAAAEKMTELFIEVVLAPAFSTGAQEVLTAKSNLRLLECPPVRQREGLTLRAIEGGFLAQTEDTAIDGAGEWTCVSERQPSDEVLAALDFAWRVVRGVKSNAVVISNSRQTVGIGAGQMSRVDAGRLAVRKARLELNGCVAASDAFFPFRDGLDVLADAGVTAIVQPGGSKRDAELIDAANERGLMMMFTGKRHFKH